VGNRTRRFGERRKGNLPANLPADTTGEDGEEGGTRQIFLNNSDSPKNRLDARLPSKSLKRLRRPFLASCPFMCFLSFWVAGRKCRFSRRNEPLELVRNATALLSDLFF